MLFPFEVPFDQLQSDLETYVDAVFDALRSDFMTMPKGKGFVEYAIFEQGYEALKRATEAFRKFTPEVVTNIVYEEPITFVVLRAMLGFSPPEWAYMTTQRTGVQVPQGAARTLDRTVRLKPLTSLRSSGGVTAQRIRSMVETACLLLNEGAKDVAAGILHRLDKADTRHGLESLQPIADLGLPYAMVLYERFLGRPFAGHRDSISELVGDLLESAIETVLTDTGISFRKTKRAERIAGFDQAPDFIVPDEFNTQIVIEAKLTEDDGTARDKITRVQHLGSISMQGRNPSEPPRFEVTYTTLLGQAFTAISESVFCRVSIDSFGQSPLVA